MDPFQSTCRTLQGIETVDMIRKGRVRWLVSAVASSQNFATKPFAGTIRAGRSPVANERHAASSAAPPCLVAITANSSVPPEAVP